MRRLRFSVRTCAFDDVGIVGYSSSLLAVADPDTFKESIKACTILVCSLATTGQGELALNARKFFKQLLKKKLPSDCLSDTLFALFGLGDSSYPK